MLEWFSLRLELHCLHHFFTFICKVTANTMSWVSWTITRKYFLSWGKGSTLSYTPQFIMSHGSWLSMNMGMIPPPLVIVQFWGYNIVLCLVRRQFSAAWVGKKPCFHPHCSWQVNLPTQYLLSGQGGGQGGLAGFQEASEPVDFDRVSAAFSDYRWGNISNVLLSRTE